MGGHRRRNPMSIRSAVAIASILVASLATPHAATAGKVKSPLFAVVDADGHLTAGKGAINTFRYHTGDYYVDFVGDLTLCAFSGTTSSGYAATVGVHNEAPGTSTSRVRVFVVDANAAAVNLGFYLIAVCPK